MASEPTPLPQNGNIQASLKVDSVGHILGFVVPVLGYYLWGGGIEGKIPLGVKINHWLASVNLKSMEFNPIDPFTTATLEWVPNSNSELELHINNITADLHLNLWVWVGHVFPMWGADVKTKDLNVTVDFSFSDVYDVFPQVHIKPMLEATEIWYDFWFLGFAIRMFLDQDTVMTLIEDALTSASKGLNEALRSPSSTSYLLGLYQDLLINAGPSRPIVVNWDTDLLEFGLDGRIFDSASNKYKTKRCEKRAERFERSHPNQIFIHESSVEDVARNVLDGFFPLELETSAANQLLELYIPELREYFGEGASYKFKAEVDDAFRLHFKMEHGI